MNVLFRIKTPLPLRLSMRRFLISILATVFSFFSFAENIPMTFCGLRLGQKLPDGIEPTSKTERYYGYTLPAKETILDYNQYGFHASLVTKTVTSAGAGYVTQSPSEAESLFQRTCEWLEKKYPGKRCESANLPNRTIKVMRFGPETDGYYMVERNQPTPGMHLVLITLFNSKLSELQEAEAQRYAKGGVAGQNAPLQFNVQQLNQKMNQGQPILSTQTVATVSVKEDLSEKTRRFMRAIRGVIESHQAANATRSVPKGLEALKKLGQFKVDSWKDGWGTDFSYEYDGDRWALQSAGEDTKFGTDDDLIFICEDGMNVSTIGFPTGNGTYLDKDVVTQNDRLNKTTKEDVGGLPDGWTLVDIPNFLSVAIPPTMELQKGAYKAFKEAAAKITLDLDMRSSSLTFQQAGLNDLAPGSTRRYARILFKSVYDKDEDFTFNEDELTADVLKNLEDKEYSELKKMMDQVARSTGNQVKLIKWFPIQKIKFGGLSGYKISFLRQQRDNPPVYVEEYKIGNGKYLHCITFSYRQSESTFWKDDYEQIKKRIVIKKQK